MLTVLVMFRNTISIHTSAREVTHPFHGLSGRVEISIHTSAREVTVRSVLSIPSSQISIHTSAREVTPTTGEKIYRAGNFNPHFRKGSDQLILIPCEKEINFNPHFRKGSDPCRPPLLCKLFQFQSTLPQGK